jgi:hypothetical protein
MGVLDAIESQEEPVLPGISGSKQILYPQELALPNHRQYTLMGVSAG